MICKPLKQISELLRDAPGASNPTLHLSLIALMLSHLPGPCKPVKRRDWLNLSKLADSEHTHIRHQVATILACASRKESIGALVGELLVNLEMINESLVVGETVPEARSAAQLNESFLVLKQKESSLEKVDFISAFIRAHVLYHGCEDFPIELVVSLWRKSAQMPAINASLSLLLKSLVQHHWRLLVPLSRTLSTHIIELSNNRAESVRRATRELAREWFTRGSSTLVWHHQFGEFVRRELGSLESAPIVEKSDRISFVGAIVVAFGAYLTEDDMLDLVSVILRMLKDALNKDQAGVKGALFELAESLVSSRHRLAPLALCQLHHLTRAHLNRFHTFFRKFPA